MITNKSLVVRVGHTEFWPVKIVSRTWFDYQFAVHIKIFLENLFGSNFFQSRGISLSHVVTNYYVKSFSAEVFVHDSRLYDFFNTSPSARVFRRARLSKIKRKKYNRRHLTKPLFFRVFRRNKAKFPYFSFLRKHKSFSYNLKAKRLFVKSRRYRTKHFSIRVLANCVKRSGFFKTFSGPSLLFKYRFKKRFSFARALKRVAYRLTARRLRRVRYQRFFFLKNGVSNTAKDKLLNFCRYVVFRSYSRQTFLDQRFSKKKSKYKKFKKRVFRKRLVRSRRIRTRSRRRKLLSVYKVQRFKFAGYVVNQRSSYFYRQIVRIRDQIYIRLRLQKKYGSDKYKKLCLRILRKFRKKIKKVRIRRRKKKNIKKYKKTKRIFRFRPRRRRWFKPPVLPFYRRGSRFIFFNQYSAYASYRFIRYRFYHFISRFVSSQIYKNFGVPVCIKFSFFPVGRGTSSFYLNYITTKLYYRYILSDVVKPIVRISLKYYRGFVIHCKGRFTRAQMAVSKRFSRRSVSYSKINSYLNYAQKSVVLKYGTCNLRIWIRH